MGYSAVLVILVLWIAFKLSDVLEELSKYRKSRESVDSLKKEFFKLLIAIATLIITVLKEVV